MLTMMVRRTNTAQLAKQTLPWLVIMERPDGWPPLPAPCPAWSPPPPAPPVMEALLLELAALLAAPLPFLLAAACATLQAVSWGETVTA